MVDYPIVLSYALFCLEFESGATEVLIFVSERIHGLIRTLQIKILNFELCMQSICLIL